MESNLKILNTGANGSGFSSILTFHNNKKCLINVGDSTLRFCEEIKEKLFHVIVIIITSFAPHNYSGLPSVLLTLSDLGVGNITIFGPPGLEGILHLMSPFTNRKYPEINIVEVKKDIEIIKIDTITIFIQPVWVKDDNNDNNSSSPIAISSIITSNYIENELSKTSSLLITPIEYNFNTYPNINDILKWGNQNDCKVTLFIPLTIEINNNYNNNDDINLHKLCKDCSTIGIYFTGTLKPNIYEFKQPQKSIFIANLVCKYLFPQFNDNINNKIMNDNINNDDINVFEINFGDIIEAIPYTLVKIPYISTLHDKTKKRKLNNQKITIEYNQPKDLTFSNDIRNTMKICNEIEFTKNVNIPSPQPYDFNLIFLGTGAAKSSKYRNNSCICINSTIFSTSSKRVTILLDVGESVCTQIFYSVNRDLIRYYNFLVNISCIWISHHHADHICGLPFLLEQIFRAYKELNFQLNDKNSIDIDGIDETTTNNKKKQRKILIICSDIVLKYYEYCACIAGLENLVEFMPINQTLYVGCTKNIINATDGFIQRLISIPVQHCHDSYAVVLEIVNGYKIVYSGDCRPSPSIISAGMNCDLLIHEATFDDTLSCYALRKRHSTTSEAIGMGIRMKCKHIILTHFSQRYLSTAQVEISLNDRNDHNNNDYEEIKAFNYAVAYDFMHFSFPSQINVLHSITTIISKLYEKYYEKKSKNLINVQSFNI